MDAFGLDGTGVMFSDWVWSVLCVLLRTAHVRNKTHFVLLTAWNDAASNFLVNDPYFDVDVRGGRAMSFVSVLRVSSRWC